MSVFEFTVLSNISRDDVGESYLLDQNLLFSEDLVYLQEMIAYASIVSKSADAQEMNVIKHCLLGLWCMNNDNKWDMGVCSLSRCIKDIDEKLRRCLVTEKSVDDAKQTSKGKNKKRKQKSYPDNPEMVEAPALFKEYLNISCLTRDQFELFQCTDKFKFVEGPAGTGKTLVMLGKVINIALNESNKRILIILQGGLNPVPDLHFNTLNNIREDIACVKIVYSYRGLNGALSERLDKAHSILSNQLARSTEQIVLLKLDECLVADLYHFITKYFDYVFLDDFQALGDLTLRDISSEPSTADKNFITEGLLPVVQNRSTHNISIWVFSDKAQSMLDRVHNLLVPGNEKYSMFTSAVEVFKNIVENVKELSLNLRNTYEISAVLSIIRTHCKGMDFAGSSPVTWPQQKSGHYLRGAKPVFYFLQSSNTAKCSEILEQELVALLGGTNRSLTNKDIAVIVDGADYQNTRATVNTVMEKWESAEDEIQVLHTGSCASAEFAAVIIVYRYRAYSETVTLPSNSYRAKEITLSYLIPTLYPSLSRARVYSSVVVFDYTPDISRYDDALLVELKNRNDVCTVIEK